MKISPQVVASIELRAKTESIKYLNENQLEVKLILNEKLMEKLTRLKHLKSHKSPGMNTVELIELLADQELRKTDPMVRSGEIKKSQCDAKPLAEVMGFMAF